MRETKRKMTYDHEKSELKNSLPEDKIFDGAIVDIRDGVVRDFVLPEHVGKWKEPDSRAINVYVEIKHDGMNYKFDEIITYINEGDKTIYTKKSKLGKFAEKYGKLPVAGLEIKAMLNKKGYLAIKLE